MEDELNNTNSLSVLVPSVLEGFFYFVDCPPEKKLFSIIQTEISHAGIENDQATPRENTILKYYLVIYKINILHGSPITIISLFALQILLL